MPRNPKLFDGSLIRFLRDNLNLFADHFDEIKALVGLIQEWVAITDPADTVAGLRKRIDLAIRAAELGVPLTPTEVDDKILAGLKSVLSSDALLSLILDILKTFDGDDEPAPIPDVVPDDDTEVDPDDWEAPEAMKLKAAPLGAIDWQQLYQIALLIKQLFDLFAKK